jgi:hypothetical protein
VCQAKTEGVAGVIVTKKGHGLIILHKLESGAIDELTEIKPDEGETFATIESGAECAIGAKVNVIGKATLRDCLVFKEFAVKHLVEIGPLTELWTISKTTEHVATILGSSWAFLTGAHLGLKWAGEAA